MSYKQRYRIGQFAPKEQADGSALARPELRARLTSVMQRRRQPATAADIAPLAGVGRALQLRLGLFNLGALALIGAAFGEGWVQGMFRADTTGITYAIAVVFLAGLGFALLRGFGVAREIGCARSGRGCAQSWADAYLEAIAGRDASARALAAQALRSEVAARIAPVRHIASSLVMLGLIGTVVGFIMALSGISTTMTPDVGAVSGMIARLISGMSVALYTTLEGAVLSLWLTVNHQMLSAGAARLVGGLVMRGERDAGA